MWVGYTLVSVESSFHWCQCLCSLSCHSIRTKKTSWRNFLCSTSDFPAHDIICPSVSVWLSILPAFKVVSVSGGNWFSAVSPSWAVIWFSQKPVLNLMCRKTKGNYCITKDNLNTYWVGGNDFNDTAGLDSQFRWLLYHLFVFINHWIVDLP